MYSTKGIAEQELCVYDSNVSHDLGWIHLATSEEPCSESRTENSASHQPAIGCFGNKMSQNAVLLYMLHILCFILLLCVDSRDSSRLGNLTNTYHAETMTVNLTVFPSSGTANLMYELALEGVWLDLPSLSCRLFAAS